MKVSPEAPIVKIIDNYNVAGSTKRIHKLTTEVLKACNVIRPSLDKLRHNPRVMSDAKSFSKVIKNLHRNEKDDPVKGI